MAPTSTAETQFRAVPELTLVDVLTNAAQTSTNAGSHFVSSLEPNESAFQSYGALLDQAKQTLGMLRAHHPPAAKPIILLIEDPQKFLRTFWACVLGGYIPCPLVAIRNDQHRWERNLSHLNKLFDHPLFACDSAMQRELPHSIRTVAIDRLDDSTSTDYVPSSPKPSDVAFLMLTSGSTGYSKAVALTHTNVLSSVAAKAVTREFTAHDVVLNWIGFDHVAALIEAHILSLYAGATQVHVRPTDILADPLEFLRVIDRFRVSTSFTPNFLLGKINSDIEAMETAASRSQPLRVELSCVRHIFSGGEANVVATCVRFLRLLAPYGLRGNVLWPAYGMTETCAAATFSKEFRTRDVQNEFASVGLPIQGFEMRIVNEHDQILPESAIGSLQVRGPMVFSHYYNNVEATASSFANDGWFRTGDTGRLEEGRLTLVGRSKDSIIVSGVNYFVQEIEAALEQLEGMNRSFVAAFPTQPKGSDTEQLVIAFATVFPVEDNERLNQLIVAIRNTTIMLWGFRPLLALPLPPSAFPKTGLGKIQRSLIRRRLELGELAEHVDAAKRLAEMRSGPFVAPVGPTETALTEAFAKLLGMAAESVSVTASFFELGGTSLELLQLTRILGQHFALDASLTTVFEASTARALSALIERRGNLPSDAYDPIVPLQESGRSTPLFCIHPGDGGTFVFVNLAQYFVNQRPVYALKPPGFNTREQCFQTFSEIVDTYAAAIQRVQPHGPYAILGYSLGGSIAFEVARNLEASGREVGFLGCIDGVPCGIAAPAAFAGALAGAAQVLNLIEKKHIASWTRVAASLQRLSQSHATKGTIAEMTVFTSTGIPSSIHPQDWRDLIHRWNEFVHKPRYVEVPGDHMNVLSPRHVVTFQEVLRSELIYKLRDN